MPEKDLWILGAALVRPEGAL
uniref:Putative porin n=1 Tax=mine drainage metagenome TaxID=410659 RepID=E6PNP3_9ZZZZ